MQSQNQKSLDEIRLMLSELKSGNYTHRIAIKADDEFLTIAVLLNLIASQLQLAGLTSGILAQALENPESPASTLALRLHEYILDHLTDDLPPVREIAHYFGTNERKAKEIFKAGYNKTIFQVHNEQRLAIAHELLVKTLKPVKEIAGICNFNSSHAFYSSFRRHYGYAPSQLRTNKN
jgi:transcriptional regulator GlxA family with amidase domain